MLPNFLQRPTTALFAFVDKLNLNFFRIHVIWFIINPLVWSVIFYLCNGENRVSYTDSLFLAVSSHTVTGLSPVNLSSLTTFQQVILFYLMCIGNYTVVSWVMVLVRKHYFVQKVLTERPDKLRVKIAANVRNLVARTRTNMPLIETFTNRTGENPVTEKAEEAPLPHDPLAPAPKIQNTRASDDEAETSETTQEVVAPADTAALGSPGSPKSPFREVLGDQLYRTDSPSAMSQGAASNPSSRLRGAQARVDFSSPLAHSAPRLTERRPTISRAPTFRIVPTPGPDRQGTGVFLSRNPTVADQTQSTHMSRRPTLITAPSIAVSQTAPNADGLIPPSIPLTSTRSVAFDVPPPATYEEGFGGFPSPLQVAERIARRVAPNKFEELKRKLTLDNGGLYAPLPSNEDSKESGNSTSMNRVRTGQSLYHRHQRDQTLVQSETPSIRPPLAPPYMEGPGSAIEVPEHLRHAGLHGHDADSDASSSTGWMSELHQEVKKKVAYLKKGVLRVGRNSDFNTDELTDEQLEELGGIEYRALRALSWIVGLYYLGTQLFLFIIFVAYLYSTHKYDEAFTDQSGPVSKAWYSAFQAVSAYTGGGLSLVDEAMVPFIDAYTLVIFEGWLICAGSMLLPAFLRLIVWILCKLASPKHKEPLQFLLDHPRRTYLYMFPSHQTWFLVVVFFILTLVQWIGFLILDIGIPQIEAIPVNQRVLAGLFQSFAVRSSGFAIIPLGAIAPACKFLFLIMMYISAYPIAMSIRSTNVYEQRSLGVYEDVEPVEDQDPDVDEGAAKLVQGAKGEILFSKYLGMHVRRQLSYDLWWLAAAVFLMCIVERHNIMDPDSDSWFNEFTILFELVSAYATIGLSLGIPTQNYSFSGALHPLSKLILCLVMLRGRHRDLPQAIDRAILLPHEFSRIRVDTEGHHIIDTPIDERPPEKPENLPSSPLVPVDGKKQG